MKAVLLSLFILSSVQAAEISNTGGKSDQQSLTVLRNQLGTGTPAPMITVGTEVAKYVDDGYYHIPQYLPSHPTAGTIWPRVVQVDCDLVQGKVVCDGYNWTPAQGRAEYIMIVPKMREKPEPVLVQVPVPVPAEPIVVYKEVPVKKTRE